MNSNKKERKKVNFLLQVFLRLLNLEQFGNFFRSSMVTSNLKIRTKKMGQTKKFSNYQNSCLDHSCRQ